MGNYKQEGKIRKLKTERSQTFPYAYKKQINMKKAIIIANGNVPLKSQINFLWKVGYDYIVCADGGANSAKKLKIVPDLIIGDLDSIAERNKRYFSNKCEIIKLKRQNDTDVEKALKYLISKNFTEAILLGATGDRLDHSICNLGIVLKFYDKIKVSILHEKSFLKPYTNTVEITTIRDEIISLYGFDDKTKIKSKGLKYQLKNIALPFGKKESTSNFAKGNKISFEISEGIIFVIRDFNLLKKHDLI